MAYKKAKSPEKIEETENTVLRRQKLLYLLKLLSEETDENEGISQPVIKARLEESGISVNRKAMYYDIQAINEFCDANEMGFHVECGQGRNADYRVTSRFFEQHELRLLCDAVSSAKFITEKKANELITKISRLGMRKTRASLRRNLTVMGRKSVSEKEGNSILYNVDRINCAIDSKKKISFQYFQYDNKGRKVERKGVRVVSPYDLVWNDEQYYLLCLCEENGEQEIRNFRVDRMGSVEVLEEKASPKPRDYNVSDRVSQAFSMFSSESTEVRLKFYGDKLMNPVIDRFGTKVRITESNKQSFTIRASVQPSAPFYGWLFQFGEDVEIISPKEVREEYEKRVEQLYKSVSEKKK